MKAKIKTMKNVFSKIIHNLMSLLALASVFWGSLVVTSAQVKKISAVADKTAVVQTDQTAKKRALLIGVSQYCRNPQSNECSGGNREGKDWWDLNTKPDVEALSDVLKNKFKFDEVVVLETKAQTTHKSIIDNFRKVLIEKTQPGDIVYFHYSGHGQSIPDDKNPGDVEPDGMDESIIPSDYVSRQDYSNNIRDDEIGKLLDELKVKKPGNVTITFDSCFSGTATRGELVQRGDSWHGKMPAAASRGMDNTGTGLTSGAVPQDYVFLSAASPSQVALEDYDIRVDKRTGKKTEVAMGLFTLALSQALNQATPKTSYRDLFYQINAIITGRKFGQDPQIEGKIDTAVMNGAAAPVEPFILILPDADGKAALQAGSLQGISTGSKYAVCPAQTRTLEECKTTKITDATVGDVAARQSTLTFANGKTPKLDREKPLRAFETERKVDFSALQVAYENLDSLTGGTDASTAIRGFGLADVAARGSKSYDVLVRPATTEDAANSGLVKADFKGAVLQRRDGTIFAAAPAGSDLASGIKKALENEVRWKTVAALDNNNPDIKVEMNVTPTTGKLVNGEFTESEEGKKMSETARGASGLQSIKVEDFIRLEVKNPNDFPIYVTILNLTADGKVAPAYPNPRICLTPCNNQIAAGGNLVRYFRITPPIGQESFKVLATLQQTDFSPLITPELLKQRGGVGSLTGSQRGGAESPLGKLFQSLSDSENQAARRGIDDVTAPPQDWATATVTYKVVTKPQ